MDSGSSPEALLKARPSMQQKRTRVVLSCAPCRNSKLKCDREQPCSQCRKKARIDLCVYAPKPERKRPVKGMAARVKRLEGMVRDMMDGGASNNSGHKSAANEVRGQVVQFEEAPTYVGATHCLAMLEDIQDIKTYFEEVNEDEDNPPAVDDEVDTPDVVLLPRAGPKSQEELFDHLPDKEVVDRIIMRYFESMSPSQHVMHRPSFQRMYTRFWQDPSSVPMHWVAQLFMMLAMGSLFSLFSAPHEISSDSPVPVMDRIREFRNCAGWALIWGKYTQPTMATLPAFILFVESQFVFNRATQMPCYILSGVCMRLMLKMGLHRDPSKLANISPFEGEMRRRTWNMAMQLETLVSFHMGLPSMMQGIESDTLPPRNLHDEDFDEDSAELPPARPSSDQTLMTYPIHKTQILRMFGKIAQHSHSLSVPAYGDVLALDKQLNQTWDKVPAFLKVRPLDECAGESPNLLIQRFGLAALYDKSRCVLHRRFISETAPKPEHDYSRKQCLEAALTLLNNQYIIWQGCKPGGTMASAGWFVSSLAIHDYLLAAVVIFVIVQNETYASGGWLQDMTGLPTSDDLKQLIKRSYDIWLEVSRGSPELRKTAGTLATMLGKVGWPVNDAPDALGLSVDGDSAAFNNTPPSMDPGSTGPNSLSDGYNLDTGSSCSYEPSGSTTSPRPNAPYSQEVSPIVDKGESMNVDDSFPGPLSFDSAWMAGREDVDWRFLDISLAHSYNDMNNPDPGQTFVERAPFQNGVDMMVTDTWTQFAGMDMDGFT
ncbi:hypothetical protein B0I35DRAFT_479067 [Stachybotrys elegans]|uniref:Zn(2)-C6 fungal-type domain-containing protein n=1 Tax=Stachybotrys elegans TaxID=80388 RepID=A0A8K0SSW3_9HYPO|nr:hypothetical protein B0I35DRAFT_479067 [Stachybotrys elegans]